MSLINIVAFDDIQRRFYVRAAGLWDTRQALHYHHEVLGVMARVRSSLDAVSLFVDLRCLAVHASEVAMMLEQTHHLWQGVAVDKFAMIVDGALMRIQARRVAGPLTATFFETLPEAVHWLGWTDAYLASLTPALRDAA